MMRLALPLLAVIPAAPLAAQDEHAGHAMGAAEAPPSPGPAMETPPPAAAGSGPPRAADAIWGAEAMAASREELRRTHGEMPIRNFTASWSADGQTMTLDLRKPLPAGTYDVRWQAAAADGHAMRGTVTFDVR